MTRENFLLRTTPEMLGIPSGAIQAFVDAAEASLPELHSFMLLRHGQVAAEGWWAPYAPARRHMLFSLSKSFTSTAVGLAQAEGLLTVDDPVLPYFGADAPRRISRNLAEMRIHHLLSMSTGHAEDTTPYMVRRRDGNWARGFLSRPVRFKPGANFLYNTGATYMLSVIVQKVTGQTLLEYLGPRLFQPLGIADPTWESCPGGFNTGGFGLSITTEDIARFGQCFLQQGAWHDRQLAPAEWVAQATAVQISNGADLLSDWNKGYGYQFWRCRHNAYRGDGAFGQVCLVMPDQDAVLALTAGVSDMQAELNLAWNHLLPAMCPDSLPEDPAAWQALRRRLAGLALQPPTGQAAGLLAEQVSGKTYIFSANPLKLASIRFDFQPGGGRVTICDGHGIHPIQFGDRAWMEGSTRLFDQLGPAAQPVAASAAWKSPELLELTFRTFETPFYFTTLCHFEGLSVMVDFSVNLNFGPTGLGKGTATRQA
jgi:CubicO group peptidase (beta-lactamase class C family)